ncbi:unnamed protein product [Didymodactylos carnosus]|uniref:Tetratricopeptide repeat protein n=1 Tax=Didymodactylos carnosus TaxID=1234261 RepID=A0A813QBX5_9BILA|nr:unnamed protein product [Didymodactylos carnosus]CAF3546784.1 unnamed protein product [Didymodactylos carnosus]
MFALHVEYNLNVLFKYRFIIYDLFKQLNSSAPAIVYRGQAMLVKNSIYFKEGSRFTTNTFLLATVNKQTALTNAKQTEERHHHNLQQIVFIIHLDNQRDNNLYTYITNTEYVLISTGIHFIVNSVERQKQENNWVINITSYEIDEENNDNDPILNDTIYKGSKFNQMAATYLHSQGMFERLIQFYQLILIEKPINEKYIHYDLADVYYKVGKYLNALEQYQLALRFCITTNDYVLTYTYLGRVYTRLEDFDQANYYLKKALNLFKQRDAVADGLSALTMGKMFDFLGVLNFKQNPTDFLTTFESKSSEQLVGSSVVDLMNDDLSGVQMVMEDDLVNCPQKD